jgi:hypothetical protein
MHACIMAKKTFLHVPTHLLPLRCWKALTSGRGAAAAPDDSPHLRTMHAQQQSKNQNMFVDKELTGWRMRSTVNAIIQEQLCPPSCGQCRM